MNIKDLDTLDFIINLLKGLHDKVVNIEYDINDIIDEIEEYKMSKL